MAGFRDTLFDGLALVLVGGGLATAAASYVGNLPEGPVSTVRAPMAWEDPVTTGSIARAGDRDADETAFGDGQRRDPWVDPPSRGREHPGRGPV